MPIPRRTPLITLMRLEAKHVAALNTLLGETLKDLDAQIAGMDGKNPITVMQAKAQRAAMNDFMGRAFDNLEDVTRVGMVEAAGAASLVVSQYEDQLLKLVLDKKTMAALARSESLRAAAGLEAALKRMQGTSYKPLSKTVYDTKQLASGWVDNTINRALAAGWSRQQLAKELRKSIDPKVPGGVSYAANRTARTEINNAFHASSAERYMNSVIVEGVDWNLSSSHPEGDICDQLADDSPYDKKNVPQKPHPNCYCFITPALPTEEEFMEKLFNGDYDGDATWADAPAKAKAAASVDFSQMTEAQLSKALSKETDELHNISKRLGLRGKELFEHPEYIAQNEIRAAIMDARLAKLKASAQAAPAKLAKKVAAKKAPAPAANYTKTLNGMKRAEYKALMDDKWSVDQRLNSMDSTDNKIRYAAKNAGVSEAQMRATVRKNLQKMVDDAEPSAMVNSSNLDSILDSGLRSTWDTKTGIGGGDEDYLDARRTIEEINWGRNNHPVYGFLDRPSQRRRDMMTGKNTSMGALDDYGDVQLKFKPDVRDRSSVTMGDSMNESQYVLAADARKVDEYSLGKGFENVYKGDTSGVAYDYIELQIHGPVTAGDIAEVIFKSEPNSQMKSKLKSLGIDWRVR